MLEACRCPDPSTDLTTSNNHPAQLSAASHGLPPPPATAQLDNTLLENSKQSNLLSICTGRGWMQTAYTGTWLHYTELEYYGELGTGFLLVGTKRTLVHFLFQYVSNEWKMWKCTFAIFPPKPNHGFHWDLHWIPKKFLLIVLHPGWLKQKKNIVSWNFASKDMTYQYQFYMGWYI